ncbi:MAG: hypothetical protein JXN10_08435 [Clostridia bacterium]|nr:hypothetical protein [Clostridia bacterium]MBN2883543.1 hypothetical protein [Clostridia bacterium]
MYYFTSITTNYMAKAKVLCSTLKQYNHDARFVLVVAGDIPENIEPSDDMFDHILSMDEIRGIKDPWIFKFKYNVTELCTALKPFAAKQIIEDYDTDRVVYLDPDIMVFGSFEKVEEILETKSMVFTPHQTSFEKETSFIKSNEILFLKRGTMNLGFFGVRNDEEGIRFLNWWAERLQDYCFDDNYELMDMLSIDGLLGLFTDQKWIDLVPSYFDNYHILKDPGYNMCTWNMNSRNVAANHGKYMVNGRPLVFFHFSGYDSGGHINELNRNIAANPTNFAVIDISKTYTDKLSEADQERFGDLCYTYAKYDNGKSIRNFERKILLIRTDIQEHFPNPFDTSSDICYHNWVRRTYRDLFPKEERRLIDNAGVRKVIDCIMPLDSLRHDFFKKLYNVFKGKK